MKPARALLEFERQADAAAARVEGRPICTGCGWSCDDPELELCCDCADAAFMAQMLRGEYGPAEQREARESRRFYCSKCWRTPCECRQ